MKKELATTPNGVRERNDFGYVDKNRLYFCTFIILNFVNKTKHVLEKLTQ